jgi:hypothetical protein
MGLRRPHVIWMILGVVMVFVTVFGAGWLVMAGLEDDAAERRLARELEQHMNDWQ